MPLKSVVKPCRIRVVPIYLFIASTSLKPMRKIFNLRGIPASLAILASCVLSFGQQIPVGVSPQYQDKPVVADDKEKKVAEATPVGAAVDANTYKVGAADVLKIAVWNEEKFTQQVVVQQNGKFTMPLVGDIQGGDSTPKEIEAAVAKALTKYVVKPLVTVTVLEVGSKKYYLVGMVNHPGEYALAVPTTVLDAISKSGGLQDFANKKKIYVLRGSTKIPFNYKEVISGKNMAQNILLEPGDHVVVN
jgi:polysaccharide export outer membrane protein